MTRVLVVDDVPDLRLLDRLVLSAAGYDVCEAASGQEALDLLAEDPAVDAIVLDVQMPEMNGWDTLSAIRADPATAEMPVVLCTVKDQHLDTIRGWKAGADDYLLKPFPIANLVTVVGDLTSRTEEERLLLRAQRLQRLGASPSGGGG